MSEGFARVCDVLCDALQGDTPLVVAVDGIGGSGKTTFAARLMSALADGRQSWPTVVVHADDFFHPSGIRHSRGRESAEGFWLDAYDLPALTEAVRTADSGVVTIVEGTFLLREELVELWDFSIFLDVRFDVASHRMAAREGLTGPHPLAHRYFGAQLLYFAAAKPGRRADIVADMSYPDEPAIIDAESCAAAAEWASSSRP